MNDIESLRDYLLADMIMKIQSLSKETLVRELVELKSKEIESASPDEILRLCQQNKHDER